MPAPYEIPPLGTLERHPKAVRQWEAVYTSARDRGFSKPRSAQQAWAAVKRAGYYQDATGTWRAPSMAKKRRKKTAKRKTKKSRKTTKRKTKRKTTKRKTKRKTTKRKTKRKTTKRKTTKRKTKRKTTKRRKKSTKRAPPKAKTSINAALSAATTRV